MRRYTQRWRWKRQGGKTWKGATRKYVHPAVTTRHRAVEHIYTRGYHLAAPAEKLIQSVLKESTCASVSTRDIRSVPYKILETAGPSCKTKTKCRTQRYSESVAMGYRRPSCGMIACMRQNILTWPREVSKHFFIFWFPSSHGWQHERMEGRSHNHAM